MSTWKHVLGNSIRKLSPSMVTHLYNLLQYVTKTLRTVYYTFSRHGKWHKGTKLLQICTTGLKNRVESRLVHIYLFSTAPIFPNFHKPKINQIRTVLEIWHVYTVFKNTILLLQQQDQCWANCIYLGAEILSVIHLLKYLTYITRLP